MSGADAVEEEETECPKPNTLEGCSVGHSQFRFRTEAEVVGGVGVCQVLVE